MIVSFFSHSKKIVQNIWVSAPCFIEPTKTAKCYLSFPNLDSKEKGFLTMFMGGAVSPNVQPLIVSIIDLQSLLLTTIACLISVLPGIGGWRLLYRWKTEWVFSESNILFWVKDTDFRPWERFPIWKAIWRSISSRLAEDTKTMSIWIWLTVLLHGISLVSQTGWISILMETSDYQWKVKLLQNGRP